MKSILCFGDANTYEESLNGRTTVLEDEAECDKSGKAAPAEPPADARAAGSGDPDAGRYVEGESARDFCLRREEDFLEGEE